MFLFFDHVQITADVATDSAEYEVECDSCPDLCSDCWVHDNHVHTCEPVPAHTNSPAAGGTLYSLQLDRGYWRYSVTSKEILRCYEAGACIGGIAAIGDTRADEDAYCGEGYTGPCEAVVSVFPARHVKSAVIHDIAIVVVRSLLLFSALSCRGN